MRKKLLLVICIISSTSILAKDWNLEKWQKSKTFKREFHTLDIKQEKVKVVEGMRVCFSLNYDSEKFEVNQSDSDCKISINRDLNRSGMFMTSFRIGDQDKVCKFLFGDESQAIFYRKKVSEFKTTPVFGINDPSQTEVSFDRFNYTVILEGVRKNARGFLHSIACTEVDERKLPSYLKSELEDESIQHNKFKIRNLDNEIVELIRIELQRERAEEEKRLARIKRIKEEKELLEKAKKTESLVRTDGILYKGKPVLVNVKPILKSLENNKEIAIFIDYSGSVRGVQGEMVNTLEFLALSGKSDLITIFPMVSQGAEGFAVKLSEVGSVSNFLKNSLNGFQGKEVDSISEVWKVGKKFEEVHVISDMLSTDYKRKVYSSDTSKTLLEAARKCSAVCAGFEWSSSIKVHGFVIINFFNSEEEIKEKREYLDLWSPVSIIEKKITFDP